MKFSLSFVLVCLVLSSCTNLYFTNLQPSGGKELTEIPENLRGRWNCKYDSIGERECSELDGYTILSDQIKLKEANGNTRFNWEIGQDVKLLELNGYYLLNLIESKKLVHAKGKSVSSPLYSAIVIHESEGVISVWNVDKPWNKASERKIRHGKLVTDPSSTDTSNMVTNILLNFSLKESDLEKICASKPGMMLLEDGMVISGDEIEWIDYDCEGPMFENPSDNRNYYKWSDKIFRLQQKEAKLQRKQDVLIYRDQYQRVFGDAPKGYTLVKTEEYFADSSEVKHPFNFSENPKKYEVYRLVVYYKDVAPRQQDLLYIDKSLTIPNEFAQEFIQLQKVSYITFKVNGKAVEEGVTTWKHLSEEDKKALIELLGYQSVR